MDLLMHLKIHFFLILTFSRIQISFEYVEISVNYGESMIKNSSLMDYDNIRVRRINKTDHAISGVVKLYVQLGKDYDVNYNHTDFIFFLNLVTHNINV